MIIRFSELNTNISMACFYALLSAHHALHREDVHAAALAYSTSCEYGLVWC